MQILPVSFIMQVLRMQIESNKMTKNFHGQSQSKL